MNIKIFNSDIKFLEKKTTLNVKLYCVKFWEACAVIQCNSLLDDRVYFHIMSENEIVFFHLPPANSNIEYYNIPSKMVQ